MRARSRWVVPVLLLGSLVLVRPVAAKELVKVTIRGPGLPGAVELTAPSDVRVFRDWHRDGLLAAPSAVGTLFYELLLHVGHGQGIAATDVYHYYPAAAGERSYVYYAEVRNGRASTLFQWFVLSTASDQAVRNVLAGRGATSLELPQERRAGTAGVLPATGRSTLWMVDSLLGCLLVASGMVIHVLLLVRRRAPR